MSDASGDRQHDMRAIVYRLRLLTRAETQDELAKVLAMSPKTLNDCKHEGRVPYARIVQFAMRERHSIEWILTGEIFRCDPEKEQLYRLIEKLREDYPKERSALRVLRRML
jgi:hypothetical protein